jgi:hypothetical protein
MQSSSRSLSFKQGLIGASPITDANVRVAQLDQSATVRRWRPQVRFLPWTPFSKQDIRDELINVRRQLPMLANHDNQLPGKPCWQRNS